MCVGTNIRFHVQLGERQEGSSLLFVAVHSIERTQIQRLTGSERGSYDPFLSMQAVCRMECRDSNHGTRMRNVKSSVWI